MRLALSLHRDLTCPAVTAIDVEVARPAADALVLRYLVTGAIADLRIPPPAAPTRADELWRHTCFEAFVRPPLGAAYCELNFAPSTQWAAYRFTGYREGMSELGEVSAPRIEARTTEQGFELRAALELSAMPADAPWRLGLSAVIEEKGGRTSYWALAHPPGKADFHHPDCFAAELQAPGRP
jgi:hypothetical protein